MKWHAAILGCALLGVAAPANVHAQQFTMKLSSPTVNDVTREWMKELKAGVEARSNGRIKVEIYPASQLGQIPATVARSVPSARDSGLHRVSLVSVCRENLSTRRRERHCTGANLDSA
jgi:TRAP-type C4-dicarboxylate transport system substrate-binding protein